MASNQRSSRLYASPLTVVERTVYFVSTVCSVAYICYCVYRDSIKYDGSLNMYDFRLGWKWLGREQDISNFEWKFWYSMFWRVWPWYLGHVILGKIMEWTSPPHRKYVFLVYSVVGVCELVGWKPVALFLVHSTLMYITSLTGSSVLVWVVSLAELSTLNFEPFISWMSKLIEDDVEQSWYYLLMFTLAFVIVKSTSFCLEKCWNMKKDPPTQDVSEMYKELKTPEANEREPLNTVHEDVGYSYIDQLVYVFYLPLFFTGPILTFDLYKKQMNTPLPDKRCHHIKLQILHLFRFCFWAMFNEFILHLLYFNSIQHIPEVLRSVSLFTLAGLGYLHGQFFMVKYLVMFGLPGTIAKFDYLKPPDGPKCIAYIYLYSDMWKYFDRGLYSFLKRYIYVPCGGSQTSFFRQVLGSLLCFMYIFYWHGAEDYILLWILLNYAGVSMEKIGALICNISMVKHLETEVLSAGMVQRIHAFFSIPIFLLSCFSMFCFFGGSDVGFIFFQRLILEGSVGSFLVLTVLIYCAIQNGMEVNRWVQKREKMKQS